MHTVHRKLYGGKKKRYTDIYELEKKTTSKSWAVHRIYAKKVYFLNSTAASLSLSEISGEKKERKSCDLQDSPCPWDQTGLGPEVKGSSCGHQQSHSAPRVGSSQADLEPKLP